MLNERLKKNPADADAPLIFGVMCNKKGSKMEADKYAGIVTVIAVILAVIYADGDYDIWDGVLGLLAVVLSLIYKRSISRDKFTSFLFAFLFSLGFAVILYSAIPLLPFSKTLTKLITWKYRGVDAQFIFVVVLTLSLSVIWYRLSHNKKIQPTANADG